MNLDQKQQQDARVRRSRARDVSERAARVRDGDEDSAERVARSDRLRSLHAFHESGTSRRKRARARSIRSRIPSRRTRCTTCSPDRSTSTTSATRIARVAKDRSRRLRCSRLRIFSDWQLTTIQTAQANQATTAYWNVPALRTAASLTYEIPRVGFFSTPAFFANWATNASNEMRVTLNQTLIVATGAQVDGTDTTQFPQNPPGLDSAHATGVCLGCHDSLDPSRSILAATYSWSYHNQRRSDVQPWNARAVRVSRRREERVERAGSRRDPREPSAHAERVGSKALLLREFGAVRDDGPGVSAHRRALSVVVLFVERSRSRARDVAAHDERDGDANDDRRRRDDRRVAPRSFVRVAQCAPRIFRRVRARCAAAGHVHVDDESNRVGASFRRLWARRTRSGFAERAFAFLSRRDRRHLRSGLRSK